MPQVITSQRYGQRTILRSWHSDGRQIVENENHTFSRWSGDPIQSWEEIEGLIPPGPHRERARRWWEHRDEIEDDGEAPMQVGWVKGVLTNLDTGERLTTIQQVLVAFPEPGPFQEAALQHVARYTQQQPRPSDLGIAGDLPFVVEPKAAQPPGDKRDKTGKFLPRKKE